MQLDDEVIRKFWDNVNKTDACWMWSGKMNKSCGTPIIHIHRRKGIIYDYSARYVSLELAGKPIPTTNQCLLTCGNKLCVKPDHLIYDTVERFWFHVYKLDETRGGCWVWTGLQSKKMYGKFRFSEDGKKKDMLAHIYSWQLYSGRPVIPGMFVCHKCDHPYCVNPDHLFLGTPKDNAQDMMNKSRRQYKLDTNKVRDIEQAHRNGTTCKELAIRYNVNIATIYDVCSGRTWKHYPTHDPPPFR